MLIFQIKTYAMHQFLPDFFMPFAGMFLFTLIPTAKANAPGVTIAIDRDQS